MHAMPCQSSAVARGQANTDSPVQRFPEEYHRSWIRICRHLEKQASENGTRCNHNGCPSRNSLLTSRIRRNVGRQKQQRRILSRRQGNVGRIIVITSWFRDIRHGQHTPLNVCSAQSRSPGELSRTSNVTVLVARLVARIAGACRCRTSVEIAFDIGDARNALLALLSNETVQSRGRIVQCGCICAVKFDRLGALDNDEGKFESKVASLTGLLAAKYRVCCAVFHIVLAVSRLATPCAEVQLAQKLTYGGQDAASKIGPSRVVIIRQEYRRSRDWSRGL